MTHPLDVRPVVVPAPPFVPPAATATALANGTPVWVLERAGLPLVSLEVHVAGGRSLDQVAGLAHFADRMLTHGAGDRDASAFAETLEQAALNMVASTTDHSTVVRLSAHTDQLALGLELLADALCRPRFDEDEVGRVRDQVLGDIAQGQDEPQDQAHVVGNRLFFGDGALGLPGMGTAESVAAMTADQLRASWTQRLRRGLHIIAAGAVEVGALTAALDVHLGSLERVVEPVDAVEPAARTGRYLVHQPEAPQSVIRLLAPGWNVHSEARCAATLGALVLGGTFTSRLNTILREEKGWSYGARLWLHPEREHGSRVLFQTSVVAEHTGDAVTILLEQLALAANEGITEAEKGKACGASRTSVVSALDSCGRACQALGSLAAQGVKPDALQTRLAEVASCTREDINAALACIDASEGVLVVVGDRETLKDQLPGTWIEVAPW